MINEQIQNKDKDMNQTLDKYKHLNFRHVFIP